MFLKNYHENYNKIFDSGRRSKLRYSTSSILLINLVLSYHENNHIFVSHLLLHNSPQPPKINPM